MLIEKEFLNLSGFDGLITPNKMRFTRRIFNLLAALALALGVCSCEKPVNSEDPEEEIVDIQVVDGKVKFYVETDSASPRAAAGVGNRLTTVSVNGVEHTPLEDGNGRLYIEVDESEDSTYNAVYYNTDSVFGTPASDGLILPCSQFYALQAFGDFPMYAAYSKETGDRLVFKDVFAVVELSLTGTASITSVNVKEPSGAKLAGVASCDGVSLTVDKAVSFAELNCTEEGAAVPLSEASVTKFCVAVAPGVYSQGLLITVCDASHRMMQFSTEAVVLAENQVLSISKQYKPENDLIAYEGFDTFVWGGDYVSGEGGIGFSPTDEAVTADSGTELSGREAACVVVDYDAAGTGYVQSNTWSDCRHSYSLPRNVASSHRLSDSYVDSRAVGDLTYLFRCQERPGYIEVGAASTTRGIFQSFKCSAIDGVIKAKVEFDVCLKHDFDDELVVSLPNGGYIVSCRLNGAELNLEQAGLAYTGTNHQFKIAKEQFQIVTDAAAEKAWNHVEIEVDRAMGGLQLYVAAATSSSGKHGFYLDNFKVTKLSELERGSLRVLYWNIQNGMWSDQAGGYDNFVAFVKRYDPDVCVWCESATIYQDNTNTGIGNSGSTYKGYLPDGWTALAARYGHEYTAIGGCRDSYPQVVTSKYPITTLLTITDTDTASKPVAHGAGLHSVTVGGRTIYLATLHTWPQTYGYGVSSADREASTANNEGDYYREFEMDYVVSQTKNNSAYAAQQDWIFCGDFNSRSRLDNWYYNYDESDTKLLCQDVILNKTDYVDVIGTTYEGDFMATTGGGSRIDYMYASPSLFATVKNAMVVIDDWTTNYKDQTYGTSFAIPSDHRPILVDFQF